MKKQKIQFISLIFISLPILSLATPTPELFPGWPKSYTYYETNRDPTSSANLGNFNSSPDLEIACGFPFDSLYLFDYQANLLPGWPVLPQDPHTYWPSVSAIGDVDGDGENEIVTYRSRVTSDIHVFKKDGAELAGWPRSMYSYHPLNPVLADLNKDGKLEITEDFLLDTLVYVFDSEGNNYPGWPVSVERYNSSDLIAQTPAVGDLDGDGDLEIVVVTFYQAIAYNSDGSLVPGFPVPFPQDYRANASGAHPTLADLDNDGKLEILIRVLKLPGFYGYLVVLDHQGQNYPGFPLYLVDYLVTNPIAVDLDQDNSKEIIFQIGNPLDTNVYVIRKDGSPFPGWPIFQDGLSFGDPVVADINGDGALDIVLTDNTQLNGLWSRLYAYNLDGTLIEGYPLMLLGFTSGRPPIPTDANKDDTLDMVVLTNYMTVSVNTYILRLFNMKVPYNPKTILWGKYLHDPYNTSNAEFIVSQYRGDPNGDEEIDLLDIVYLVNFVFRSKAQPNPLWIGDLNCDGKVNLGDIVYLVNYYFKNGPGPCKP